MSLTNTEHNNADQQQLLPMGPNKPIKKVQFDMNHSIQEIPARDENDHGQMFRLYYDQADYAKCVRATDGSLRESNATAWTPTNGANEYPRSEK